MDFRERIIGITIFVAISILAAYLWGKESIRQKQDKFKARKVLSETEFLDLFYGIKPNIKASNEEILDAVNFFSTELNLVKGKLRPDDSLEIIGPAKSWKYDDELWTVLDILIAKTKKYKLDFCVSDCKTLADLIEVFISIEKKSKHIAIL